MKVLMRKTSATPDRILHAGHTYNLPPDEATALLIPSDSGPAAEAAPNAKKVDKVPPQPDPEDTFAEPAEDDEE